MNPPPEMSAIAASASEISLTGEFTLMNDTFPCCLGDSTAVFGGWLRA